MGYQEVVRVDDPLWIQPHELTQSLQFARVPVSANFHHLRVTVLYATAPLVGNLADFVKKLLWESFILFELQVPQVEVLRV